MKRFAPYRVSLRRGRSPWVCIPLFLFFQLSFLSYVFTSPTKAEAPALQDPHLLDPSLLEQGWISLFDGQTLYGWSATTAANWRVENGAIIVERGEPGFLRSSLAIQDFECSLEFLAEEETNSGLFCRSVPDPQDPAKDCLEVNIAPTSNPFPTGSVVARQKSSMNESFAANTWHTMEVRAEGDKISVSIDGHPTAAIEDSPRAQASQLMLQYNQGAIAFRNLRIRPLGMRPIFNGVDLDGWTTEKSLESKFRVEVPEMLRVTSGPGQLESEGQYADFLLQLECQTHANGLNSGLFFRCIPGDRLMGYEAQISNAFKESRSEPLDAGTGAIFRRQAARYVPADDQKWFYMTIMARGPHFATWVNGLQVCDWTDTRGEDANPRKGLRLAAGSLMIQGHDPTTDVSFRNLRIVEWK